MPIGTPHPRPRSVAISDDKDALDYVLNVLTDTLRVGSTKANPYHLVRDNIPIDKTLDFFTLDNDMLSGEIPIYENIGTGIYKYDSDGDLISFKGSYLESFRNCTDVLDYMTVDIGTSAKGIETELGDTPGAFGRPLTPGQATEGELRVAKASVKEAFMAVKFLAGADKARYGTVIQDLENDYTKKDDNFPKTVVDAYNLLMHWKQTPSQQSPVPAHGVAFATSGNEDAEHPPPDNTEIGGRGRGGGRGGGGRGNPGRGGRGGGRGWGRGNCCRCGQPGHFASECPAPTPRAPPEETAEQMLMSGVENDEFDDTDFVFHQLDESQYESERKHIPKAWILLDNQSTVDVFANGDLMRDIHTTTRSMTIRCNAGVTRTNMIGRVEGYPGEVWYNPNGIANILSLSNVTKYFPVSYDSRDNEASSYTRQAATVDSRNQNEDCSSSTQRRTRPRLQPHW
jgi:hypothetical protein